MLDLQEAGCGSTAVVLTAFPCITGREAAAIPSHQHPGLAWAFPQRAFLPQPRRSDAIVLTCQAKQMHGIKSDALPQPCLPIASVSCHFILGMYCDAAALHAVVKKGLLSAHSSSMIL